MTDRREYGKSLRRFIPWLLGALGVVVIGLLLNAPNDPDEPPASLVQTSPSEESSAGFADAAGIREALAEEVAANTEAEQSAGSERVDKIESILATGGTRQPPDEDATVTRVEMTIEYVIDGDTVITTDGYTIRIIGIDTPEQGMCGCDEATDALRDLVEGRAVIVTNPASVDDVDKYGRILRYVDSPSGDTGTVLLKIGLAVARYDYLDGYDWHLNQDTYRSIDAATEHLCGEGAENNPAHILLVAAPAPAGIADRPEDPPAVELDPWNLPGPPDLDCSDIGHPVDITGPDYHHLDGDGDGVGCESY